MTGVRREPRTLIGRDGTRMHAPGLGTWQLGDDLGAAPYRAPVGACQACGGA